MISSLFILFVFFVSANCQIFQAPCQRKMPAVVPAVMPSYPCGNPAPIMQVKYDVPAAIPAGLPLVVEKPAPCLQPAVTKFGTITEVPLPVAPMANQFLPLAAPLANPFLPVASPVSALAPFSPLLPPANTCSRCQYLKKIPIPPPCI